jgi:ribosomal protein S18 acetylase RimI-like enzyme
MPELDEDALRFRRDLDGRLQTPRWPEDTRVRTLLPRDPLAVYGLLTDIYPDDTSINVPFETWWRALSTDEEFDPALCFLAVDRHDRLLGVAQCWTSAFIKDLAVLPAARRRGIGENLLWHAFDAFRTRGADHVDLKVVAKNATAQRLYERVGMRRVALAG